MRIPPSINDRFNGGFVWSELPAVFGAVYDGERMDPLGDGRSKNWEAWHSQRKDALCSLHGGWFAVRSHARDPGFNAGQIFTCIFLVYQSKAMTSGGCFFHSENVFCVHFCAFIL